jgi:hypothetical protein
VACVDVNVSNLSVASRNLTMTSLKSTVVKVTEIEHERLAREVLQNRRRQRSLDRSRRATNVAQYQKSQAQERRDQRRAAQGLDEVATLPKGARFMRTKEKPVQAYRRDNLSSRYVHTRTIHGARARAATITKKQAAWAISRELVTIHGPNWIIEDCNLTVWSLLWGRAMAISAPGMVTSALEALSLEVAGSYTKVSTITTALSSTCLCGTRVKKNLGERVHRCSSCGLVGNRDLVSALLGTCVTPATTDDEHDVVDRVVATALRQMIALSGCEDTLVSQTQPLRLGRHGTVQAAKPDLTGPGCSRERPPRASSTKGRGQPRPAKVTQQRGLILSYPTG